MVPLNLVKDTHDLLTGMSIYIKTVQEGSVQVFKKRMGQRGSSIPMEKEPITPQSSFLFLIYFSAEGCFNIKFKRVAS